MVSGKRSKHGHVFLRRTMTGLLAGQETAHPWRALSARLRSLGLIPCSRRSARFPTPPPSPSTNLSPGVPQFLVLVLGSIPREAQTNPFLTFKLAGRVSVTLFRKADVRRACPNEETGRHAIGCLYRLGKADRRTWQLTPSADATGEEQRLGLRFLPQPL